MNEPKFLGVCAWVADMLDVEAKIIRILFLIGVFFFGLSIISYFVLWLIRMVVD